MTNDDAEYLDDLEESTAELIGQHNSEVSLAGDSWPGALIQIHRALDQVRAMRKEHGLPSDPYRDAHLPVPMMPR